MEREKKTHLVLHQNKPKALCCFKSIFHYAQLLTFPPTGSPATIFVRIVIDKMSLLIEK